jgi:phosphoribosyl 1,2-cyclic phosphodiesterase
MGFSFCSFASGSSGNCYLVKTDNTALLVDAGISARRINAGLKFAEIGDDQLAAILITHEHSDHVRSLSSMMRQKANVEAFANEGTWKAIGIQPSSDRRRTFKTDEPFWVGDIKVKGFPVSHDAADPVGYSFYSEGKQISIITDTGIVGEDLVEEAKRADLLILEANHDVDMLKIGRYPWFLKQRILGDRGHLSNETAARLLVRLLSEEKKERRILLAHLSRENNFPEMAYQTVKNILEEEEYYIGRHVELQTILRDEFSPVFLV